MKKVLIVLVLVNVLVCIVYFAMNNTNNKSGVSPSDHSFVNNGTENSTTIVHEIGSRENPYEITISEFVTEIQADIDVARTKYNGKWVEITGRVTDFSDGGIMYGYYIHGKKDGSGLKVMCWCDDPYKGSMVGDVYTFKGIVRDVTDGNVTEIAECVVVEDELSN